MPYIQKFLLAVSRRGDIAFALLVVMAVLMMIIPLPTALVDVLIASNIAASTLILLVAFYITRPAELSSLPSIILMAVLFRIALAITTTRLILLQGDAGETVNAFGNFVIGGNVAVGLIVFLIITVAQFVVITKGAERVAEVGARFTLDAMPGKQMNIDNDLRNGAIDQAEAQRRRTVLERESQFFGAMDGAMKFVKGDAIAGLVVIMVNLLGGLTLGVVQRGMSLADAGARYSLLTVGDGLIAQIPALLVSMAAGTVVTRVGSDGSDDVGTAIMGQLSRDPRAFGLVAAVLAALSLLPGFPTLIFLTIAAMFAAGTWSKLRRAARAAPAATDSTKSADQRIVLRLGSDLAEAFPANTLAADIEKIRSAVFDRLGMRLPPPIVTRDETLPADRFHIDLDGTPARTGTLPAGHVAVDAEAIDLDLAGLPYRAGEAAPGAPPTLWVPAGHEAAIAAAGFGTHNRYDMLLAGMRETLPDLAGQFMGIQETRNLLAQTEPEYGELVSEVQKLLPLQQLAELLRSLLAEDVPIRNLRLILEAILEWGQYHREAMSLEGFVRSALRRHICFRCADENRIIAAYVLERTVEELVRTVVHQGFGSAQAREQLAVLVPAIRAHLHEPGFAARPVILTQRDLRPGLRSLLVREGLRLPVLAYEEVAPDYSVQVIATVTVSPEGLVVLRTAAERAEAEAGANE